MNCKGIADGKNNKCDQPGVTRIQGILYCADHAAVKNANLAARPPRIRCNDCSSTKATVLREHGPCCKRLTWNGQIARIA